MKDFNKFISDVSSDQDLPTAFEYYTENTKWRSGAIGFVICFVLALGFIILINK